MTEEEIKTQRIHLQRMNGNGSGYSHLPMPSGIGVGPANLGDVLIGAQTKIDKVMADLSEKLAAVEARVGFKERITVTADAIQIEREVTMVKDRKY